MPERIGVSAIWSSFQPTLPPSEFHAAAMAVAIMAILVPGAFGFYTSLAGRPMISGRFLDD